MKSEPNQTLQPTALVHEVWIKLNNGKNRGWQGKTHFYAAAACAMRQILIDRGRRVRAIRHGGELKRVEWDIEQMSAGLNDDQILAVGDALGKLRKEDPNAADVAELRFLVGLTIKQVATVLGVGEKTVDRRWSDAKTWLFKELRS